MTAGVHNFSFHYTALRGSHSGKTSVLQVKLNKLSEFIGRIGIVVGLAFFVALFIRFFVQFSRERDLRCDILICQLLWY